MIKCPCENCICIPVCKHKSFYKLFQDCIYLRIYEPFYNIREQRDVTRLQAINDTLKSEEWECTSMSSESKYVSHVVVQIQRKHQ